MTATAATVPTGPSAPRRLVPYVAGVACASTAYIAAFTAAALAARSITGSASLSGVPNAVGVAGTALGAGLLSALMARRGRRGGLVAGYLVGALGAVTAVASLAASSFALLIVASLLFGLGNAAIQLTRYAASDALPAEERARAVGIVVWASTVGAVLGPNLLQPAGWLAERLGLTVLQGAFGLAVLAFALAATVARTRLPATAPPDRSPGIAPALAWRDVLGQARVRIALLGLVAGQVVMVLIMTMTPVHVRDTGHDIGTVGIVISAHTLGMFALSPVSGRLATRFGSIPVLYASFATLLAAAILAALAPPDAITLLTLGLFLLGFGWNLGFVAGSGLLTRGADLAERIRLQGMTDTMVWTAAAVASAASGVVLQLAGYATLAVLGGLFLAIPAVAIMALRPRLAVEVVPG